ncbi:hypothetical protein CRE_22751 [Caenorhabditis remanei]|uniref:NR LBD domain-containing protein n=1 Tax=Caenorhabditis remanei TaxID=31234 RepID=E3NVJ3_CAERE|nr:hypothetical protein CRE_22751 [Caenorhabditis remanei]
MMMNPCVVCLARGNGKHFGVDACRGCTAFFRRTVVNKRKYKCSEDETCNIERSEESYTYKETYRLLLTEFYLVADWISNSFPHFTELPTNQKDILLRNFYLTFYNLEAGFFACQRNRNDVWFLPNGNFINCQNLESFYHDPNNLQSMTSADAAKLFKGTCTGCKRNVLEPMLRENVSQFEFLALAALILFDTGLDGQTDSCVDICRKVRTTVQKEMINYYSTKRVEEYPLRMANILSIIPSVQKASQKMQSDLELGHLFNAYSAEKTFFENCMGKR